MHFVALKNNLNTAHLVGNLLSNDKHQRRMKCSLIGQTNSRPPFLSIIEDLSKFSHSYISVADRRPQSSAIQSPGGVARKVSCYAVADRRLQTSAMQSPAGA